MDDQAVCAVVVTFYPDASVRENLAALNAQVEALVVVDNGSSPESLEHVLAAHRHHQFHLIQNRENLGIAAALNQGIRWALQAGYPWIALFDQDTRPDKAYTTRMLECYHCAPHPLRVAIVVPTYRNLASNMCDELMRSSDGELLAAMSSGSLIHARVFRQLGLLEEALFIDAVDTEFCLRARSRGMLILQAPVEVTHALGAVTHHRILGHSFSVTNHSPSRRYYMTRNRLVLMRRYRKDSEWVLRECWAMAMEFVKILLAESQKRRKLAAITLGTWDAVRGRLGCRLLS
jgi:rhamnosyltransferase